MPSDVDRARPEQRVVEAAAMLPAGAVVTGWAALHWRGGRWFDGSRRAVTVVVPQHRRSQPTHRIEVVAESRSAHPATWVDGVPVTLPAWAVAFEMRRAGTVRAAARALSLAAYDDLVSVAEADEVLTLQVGMRGVRQARAACRLALENVWSPPEFDMAATWAATGRPTPRANPPVFDRQGRHLLTPDLLDPEAGVVGEYNGATHRTRSGYGRDVDRWARYAEHGLELVVMSAADVDVGSFHRRLDEAYGRAARRSADERTWTLDRPPWWVPTHTVELRRALADHQRTRWLAHRTA